MAFHLMPGLWYDSWGIEISQPFIVGERGSGAAHNLSAPTRGQELVMDAVMTATDTISPADVEVARKRISGIARRTPLPAVG